MSVTPSSQKTILAAAVLRCGVCDATAASSDAQCGADASSFEAASVSFGHLGLGLFLCGVLRISLTRLGCHSIQADAVVEDAPLMLACRSLSVFTNRSIHKQTTEGRCCGGDGFIE